MKKFIIFLMILFSTALTVFGQRPEITPIPTPSAKTSSESKDTGVKTRERQLVNDLQSAKNGLFSCYKEYFESKDADKLEKSNKCTSEKLEQLSKAYSAVYENPSALQILIAEELNTYYMFSYVQRSSGESEDKSQTELQRIIVLQNQRIIELLEQLLKKK